MDNDHIDKLLAELQAESTEKKTEVQPQNPHSTKSVSIPQHLDITSDELLASSKSKPDSLLDNLLEEVKTEAQQPKPKQQNFTPNSSFSASIPQSDPLLNHLLEEVKTEAQQPKPKQQNFIPNPSFTTSIPQSDPLINSVLEEVKADFIALEEAKKIQQQQELEQEKIRQAKLKEKQLKALKKQAQDWLNKLDPLSTEGLWFERFAEGYPSKLEAAIEYLQTNI